MDVKLLNPFVQAAVEVLKAEVGADVSRGELSLQKSSLTTDELTVMINLVGDVYGMALYGMSIETGLKFVSKIMGQEFAELDALAQSGVAELGNVISGKAAVRFSEAGFTSSISTPTILNGSGVQISTLDFPRIVVPLSTQFGTLTAHLALREKKAGDPRQAERFAASLIPPSPAPSHEVE